MEEYYLIRRADGTAFTISYDANEAVWLANELKRVLDKPSVAAYNSRGLRWIYGYARDGLWAFSPWQADVGDIE